MSTEVMRPAEKGAHDRAREVMQRHTVIGHEILGGSRSELLRLVAKLALAHHERLDGSGYPNQLGEEEIPQAARMVAVADSPNTPIG